MSGFWLTILRAKSSAPSIPLSPSLRMILAPMALRICRLSMVMFSGMTRKRLYPLTRQTMAKPMPVLPLVGSMTILFLLSCPVFSASSIMYLAMRSLTEPPMLNFSIFTYISMFGFLFSWFICTIGVLPINSKMFLAIIWHRRNDRAAYLNRFLFYQRMAEFSNVFL